MIKLNIKIQQGNEDSLVLCLFSYEEDEIPNGTFVRFIQYVESKRMCVVAGYFHHICWRVLTAAREDRDYQNVW